MPGRKVPEEQRRLEILKAAYRVAARERLTGLTAQAVAAEAGVSKGLVFFHFGNRDALLVALLTWLLDITLVAPELAERLEGRTPAGRVVSARRRDVAWLPRQRGRVELFFAVWVMGTRPGWRLPITQKAKNSYRDAFRPL